MSENLIVSDLDRNDNSNPLPSGVPTEGNQTETGSAPPGDTAVAAPAGPPPPPIPPTPPAPDPFDPARLRIDQDFTSRVGVKKLLTTVPVRKPTKETFIRTHPDPAYRLTTGVIELKEDREIYLVDPALWPVLDAETTFGPKHLVTTVTRQGVLLLWPIRMPGPDGKLDDWSRSALEAAEVARDSWVRVQANMSLGAYEAVVAAGTTAQPEFPAITMGEILKIAFKDRHITELDHPVLRRLRGEL